MVSTSMRFLGYSLPLVSVLLFNLKTANASSSLPKAAASNVPWDDLANVLSSRDLLTTAETEVWKEECWDVFVNENATENPGFQLSNYQLLYQESGLCMDHAACAYQHCLAPPNFDKLYAGHPNFLVPGLDQVVEERLNLPAYVLQPATASDIVHAVQFCKTHDIGVTVKTSGHSYYGASTGRGTLLIKMSPNYPIYSQELLVTECHRDMLNMNDTATEMACGVAKARGKNAFLRVGGGELFDHAYRSVSFEWNRSPNTTQQYHLVGGAAGTVSAAGGWLNSGGLSGTTGMRLFGLGVDQVLHIEMVLPSGTHVRFGPSAWENVEGFVIPKTTAVTGYCNANALDTEEANWDWQPCSEEEDINFDDLWFAVRGGGGGTFGITTSVYYQLHEYPGTFEVLALGAAATGILPGEEPWNTWTPEQSIAIFSLYIQFLLQFLYQPLTLNTTDAISNGCHSATTVTLNPVAGGRMYCYNGSGAAIVESWGVYISSTDHVTALSTAGFDGETIAAMPGLFSVALEVPTFADFRVSDGSIPNVPQGRIDDNPKSGVIPTFPGFPGYTDTFGVHIPLVHLADPDDLALVLEVLVEYSLTNAANPAATVFYSLGGVIAAATDQTDSVNPTRRTAGMFLPVLQDDFKSRLYDIFWDAQDGSPVTGDDFPGTSCHNHALIYENGPLKTDWTEACPQGLPQEEREELCISPQEAVWGTNNLERLETIKSVVDPNALFICAGGVGFDGATSTLEVIGDGPMDGDGGEDILVEESDGGEVDVEEPEDGEDVVEESEDEMQAVEKNTEDNAEKDGVTSRAHSLRTFLGFYFSILVLALCP